MHTPQISRQMLFACNQGKHNQRTLASGYMWVKSRLKSYEMPESPVIPGGLGVSGRDENSDTETPGTGVRPGARMKPRCGKPFVQRYSYRR